MIFHLEIISFGSEENNFFFENFLEQRYELTPSILRRESESSSEVKCWFRWEELNDVKTLWTLKLFSIDDFDRFWLDKVTEYT